MTRISRVALTSVLAAVPLLAAGSPAQAQDSLTDLLLFGRVRALNPASLPVAVRAELQVYMQRFREYKPARPMPTDGTREESMIYTARASYERRLAALSPDLKAPALAQAYVDALRPCYEWEGGRECPEREAIFAMDYLQAHAGGPFSEYLHLLIAHRRLCAAEAYEDERSPEEAERSKEAYRGEIEIALRSKSPLVATAARRLAERKTCGSF